MIRCLRCRWSKITDGTPEDLQGLIEVKNSCSDCGKPRKFRCQKCGRPSNMVRLPKTNTPEN